MVSNLNHVEPFADHLTVPETVALILMKDKVEQYVAKGRIREAQAARYMVHILWQALKKDKDIDTGWGEL